MSSSHPVYGTVTKKIITDGNPASMNLTGQAKAMSIAIGNVIQHGIVDRMTLNAQNPDGSSVNVMRYQNSEIWKLKSGGGNTLFFSRLISSSLNYLYTLGSIVPSEDDKFRALAMEPAARAEEDPQNFQLANNQHWGISKPFIYTLSDMLRVYSLSTGALLAELDVSPRNSTLFGNGRRIHATPGGVLLLWSDTTQINLWRKFEGGEFFETYNPPMAFSYRHDPHITRYAFADGALTEDVTIDLPTDRFALPAPTSSGESFLLRPQFISGGVSRFTVSLGERTQVVASEPDPDTGETGWWPVVQSNMSPIAYTYDAATLTLIDELSGQATCSSVNVKYREFATADVLNDELWCPTSYPGSSPTSFQLQKWALRTGVETVVFSDAAADWNDHYFTGTQRHCIVDGIGVLIQKKESDLTGTMQKWERFVFDDSAAGATRDASKDIVLIELDEYGIPLPEGFHARYNEVVKDWPTWNIYPASWL